MENEDDKSLKRPCEVCMRDEAKYKCPGCSFKTCSLPCVKRHKTENGCDGKRNMTEFVSMKSFNENNLLSDYRFLENASRCASNADRDHRQRRKIQKLKHVNVFFNRARSKGVHLYLMSIGMSKRRENTSKYDHKEKCLFWRVKLNFVNENTEYVIPRANEKNTIKDILKAYIHPEESDPIIRFRLKSYVDAWFDDIRIYLKREKSRDQGAFSTMSVLPLKMLCRHGLIQLAYRWLELLHSSHSFGNRYDLIDGSLSLEQCLRRKVIIEYPTFYVSISGKDSQFTGKLCASSTD